MTDKKIINANVLKWVALITMFIDHIGAGIIEPRYYPMMRTEDTIIRMIGRIAFPIFCFLLVEGYTYTRNKWKYAANLLIFAILSEVPFDILFREHFTWSYQNVYFTLLIGLFAIIVADKAEKIQTNSILIRLVQLMVMGVFAYIAYLFRTDYSFWGVCLICILYFARKKGLEWECLMGGLFMLTRPSEMIAVISFMLIYFYNGKRKNTINKYIFYAMYPIHMTLYIVIRVLLTGY